MDNLNSLEDLKFLKIIKNQSEEDQETKDSNDEYSIYLFGLKLDYDAMITLIKNCNLMQSIISLHRCMFCFKQSCKWRDLIKSKNKESNIILKDEKPI